MTKKTSILILLFLIIMGCQTNKKDLANNIFVIDTTVVEPKSYSTEAIITRDKFLVQDYLVEIPRADRNFDFNTTTDKFDTTQLVFLPDCIIDKMDSVSVFNYEFGEPQKMLGLRQLRDSYATDYIVKVGFYRTIPITTDSYDILTAFVMDSKTGHGHQKLQWQILTFGNDGHQICAISRIDEIHTSRDTLIGLWWYASDEDPTYETWVKNKDGKFNMTFQSEEAPRQIKK